MIKTYLKKQSRMAQCRWLSVAGLIFIADQGIKYWVTHSLALYQTQAILPFFNLSSLQNTGAAFSLFAHSGKMSVAMLIGFAVVVSLMVLIRLWQLSGSNTALSLAFSFILGGALGNVVDRIRFGYVVDFIDIYIGSWHWPAFNIADAAICVGLFFLLLNFIRNPASGR